MKYILYLAWIWVFVASGCRDKYPLPEAQKKVNVVVIEGNITPGTTQLTRIRVTNTYDLSDTAAVKPVNNAVVSIEPKTGGSFSLTGAGDGYYTQTLSLALGAEYRLRVKTPDGKSYVSAYLKTRTTPDIDSISFRKNAINGTDFLVNTHDPAGLSQYYNWDFEETWELRSSYFSMLKWEDPNVVIRPQADIAFVCYRTVPSNTIILGSSAQLSADRIADKVVQSMPPNDERLGVRYSILVSQRALDKSAYEFFQILKRNTETVGSIFDAQPSEMPTNLVCETDPSQSVVGYITASTVKQKRFFVEASQVPWNRFVLPCRTYDVTNDLDSMRAYFPGFQPVTGISLDNGLTIAYYQSASASCVDCRLRQGTLTKPSFW